MSTIKTQIGISQTADFEEQTWTFEMQEDFEVNAGNFAIVSEENYNALIKRNEELEAMLEELNDNCKEMAEASKDSAIRLENSGLSCASQCSFAMETAYNICSTKITELLNKNH